MYGGYHLILFPLLTQGTLFNNFVACDVVFFYKYFIRQVQ